MAARKKVRASQRNKKVQSNMPPEMRAAMQGGPTNTATTQSRSIRDRILPKMLNRSATDTGLESKHFESIDEVIYWKPETPRQRSAYIVDLGQQKLTVACVKCVFLRALDENGDRIFTTEQDFSMMMDIGNCEVFEEIGAEMLGIGHDDEDDNPDKKPAETSVESEKNE